MHRNDEQEAAPAEARETMDMPVPRSRWPFIVTGLLVGHVGAMALAVNIASGDSGHAVLPDYYSRAIDWDAKQRTLRASEQLGWSLECSAATVRRPDGRREVRLELRDDRGQPIVDATVTLRVWHHALGKAEEVLAAAGASPGAYVALAAMDRPGTWQCETRVERAEALFLDDRELVVPSLEAGIR